MGKTACSKSMDAYFKALEEGAAKAYRVAERARAKGFDPSTQVEVPRADDLASRVEKLMRIEGLAPRIRELSERHDRENVSIMVAKETAKRILEDTADREQALDSAVRVGLAVLTEGILVAPLDGIVAVRIRQEASSSYVSISYSSPIASAGGTALAMSVLIADLVRRDLGVGMFRPTEAEIERFQEEVPLYRQEVALQYLPSLKEIEAAVRGCPICIDGEGTERVEVSGHRDLPRIATNRLRGGACLVIANGLCHKSAKLKKHVEKLGIDGWDFLNSIMRLQTASAVEDRTKPSDKYLKEQLAGRPVLSQASRPGGFRLRYGRTRSTGIASLGVHPATMALTGFVALGTQLKIERPGKACVATPCDSIDGPWVLLDDGELLQLVSAEHANALAPKVREIVDLGDILVPFGEFAENNHPLMPAAWVEEWWRLELGKRGLPHAGDQEEESLVARSARDARAAVELARKGTPLHPNFTYLWHDLDARGILELRRRFLDGGRLDGGYLLVDGAGGVKRSLISLCVPHRGDQTVRVAEHWALLAELGLEERGGRVAESRPLPVGAAALGPMELVRDLSGMDVRERAPTRIGTRMGRPEKAKMRRMKPPVNLLFPLREGVVRQRSLEEVMEQAALRVEVQPRRCIEKGHVTYVPKCPCGSWSEPSGPPGRADVDLETLMREARDRLGASLVEAAIDKVKGVTGLISKDKTPECLEKGILRAAHDVWVFKDGTVRFDATDVPLTHFSPREVGISVEKARELGYSVDAEGRPLDRDDQLLELRVQDVVVPKSCLEQLFKVAQFVDDLLLRLYGLDQFYNAKEPQDLVGHMVVGLAPHTSGGVLARIVGSIEGKVCFAHPYFHAAKRRNCLHPSTELFVFNSPMPVRRSLESIYESAIGEESRSDDIGTWSKKCSGLEVLSVDPRSGLVVKRSVSRLYKIPNGGPLLRFRTRSGRSVLCSPDHQLYSMSKGRPHKVRARELREGDDLVTIDRLPLEKVSPEPIDLLRDFASSPPENMVVRGISTWLSAIIRVTGGLRKTSLKMGLSMKALDNYRRRDSLPYRLLIQLLTVLGLPIDAVPMECSLAVLRDTVRLPRILRPTPELMRLIGYYIAEGHARYSSGSAYQVSIAATEPFLVDDIRRCARACFGRDPGFSGTSITLSGRLYYHLFVDVLGLGKNAHQKSIPSRLACLPSELTKELLAAYYSGDGSVERGRLHVQCTSVSLGLLRDIGLQLTSRGIAYRLRREDRPAGGAVADFYLRKGRPMRTFASYSLSIRSSHARRFHDLIGFTLPRKQRELTGSLAKERKARFVRGPGDVIADRIVGIQFEHSDTAWLYDIEVDGLHNYLVNDFLLTSNCDGDEDSLLLLMDCLLNFSRSFLPDSRGGNMDAPLILATKIDPDEIDKEAHNLDVGTAYPIELYEAAAIKAKHSVVAKKIEHVGDRIGTPGQYEGLGFTHSSSSLTAGRTESIYASIESMKGKLDAQLELYGKLRGIDAREMIAQMLSYHFLRDMQGCLSRFARQTFRCVRCGDKYRRAPLSGSCTHPGCGGKILLTVPRGSVVKYLDQARHLVRQYGLGGYISQRVELLAEHVGSTFGGKEESRTLETFGE